MQGRFCNGNSLVRRQYNLAVPRTAHSWGAAVRALLMRPSLGDSKRSMMALALLPVPVLDTRKVSISYMSAEASDVRLLHSGQPRRYTVTHNDLTAQLHITIGEDFNQQQISGWYSRLVRDEVCAEWCFTGGLSLHLHCHVSGAAKWPAPSRLRHLIFRREMPLVLDSIVFAERQLLMSNDLWHAAVFVHFEALEKELASVEYWGTLSEWVQRGECTAEAHFERVGSTLPSVRPAKPRQAKLEGPLGGLMELIADNLVEKPQLKKPPLPPRNSLHDRGRSQPKPTPVLRVSSQGISCAERPQTQPNVPNPVGVQASTINSEGIREPQLTPRVRGVDGGRLHMSEYMDAFEPAIDCSSTCSESLESQSSTRVCCAPCSTKTSTDPSIEVCSRDFSRSSQVVGDKNFRHEASVIVQDGALGVSSDASDAPIAAQPREQEKDLTGSYSTRRRSRTGIGPWSDEVREAEVLVMAREKR